MCGAQAIFSQHEEVEKGAEQHTEQLFDAMASLHGILCTDPDCSSCHGGAVACVHCGGMRVCERAKEEKHSGDVAATQQQNAAKVQVRVQLIGHL